MQAIRNQTLENQPFVLEDCYFENCVLRNCDLFFSGGDFEWANTTFDNCRFHWRGAAKSTWMLMRLLGLMKEQLPPSNLPKSSSQQVN